MTKFLFALALLPFGASCASAPPTSEFIVRFQIATDEPEPLAGAALGVGARTVGTTDASGSLRVRISGKDGDVLPVKLVCPEHFVAPGSVVPLRLISTRKIGAPDGTAAALVWTGACTREERQVALVVHADNGEGLPVTVEGKSAGVTDADGNAHVLVKLRTEPASLHVALDTSSDPRLKPESPGRVFDLGRSDEIVFFQEKFVVAPRRPAARTVPKARAIPYRID